MRRSIRQLGMPSLPALRFGVSCAFAQLNRAFPPATFGWWNNRLDVRPLIVREIARIAQLVAIVFRAVFDIHIGGPSLNQTAATESQMIPPTQLFPEWTLSIWQRPELEQTS